MLWSKRFGVKTFQPKSLPEINYEEIINGQVEDFSPDCWLDGHIHRFANAADIIPNQNQFPSQEDVSSDSVSSDGFDSNTSSPQIGDSPRNILLDLFSPMYESGPPPYSDEPPPSYEEATSNFLDPNSSNSMGEPHDSDWMWWKMT